MTGIVFALVVLLLSVSVLLVSAESNDDEIKREMGRVLGFSQVNKPSPSVSSFLTFYQAVPHFVELQPGDALYLPSGWWHWIKTHGRTSSANFLFDTDEGRGGGDLPTYLSTNASWSIPSMDFGKKTISFIISAHHTTDKPC